MFVANFEVECHSILLCSNTPPFGVILVVHSLNILWEEGDASSILVRVLPALWQSLLSFVTTKRDVTLSLSLNLCRRTVWSSVGTRNSFCVHMYTWLSPYCRPCVVVYHFLLPRFEVSRWSWRPMNEATCDHPHFCLISLVCNRQGVRKLLLILE